MKSYKKDFRDLQNTMFMGALASNSAGLLTGKNPGDVATGMLGIGVAGAIANKSFDLVSMKHKRK